MKSGSGGGIEGLLCVGEKKCWYGGALVARRVATGGS